MKSEEITTLDQEKSKFLFESFRHNNSSIVVNDKIEAAINEGKESAERTKGVLDLMNKEAENNREEFPVIHVTMSV